MDPQRNDLANQTTASHTMASRLPSSPLAVCKTSFKAVATDVVVRHDAPERR